MKIALRNFEAVIDPVIVSRGKEYFRDKAVRTLTEIRKDHWATSVEGTDIYTVRVALKGDDVSDCSCSCPYEFGPVCKHIVAVLFSLKAGVKAVQGKKAISKKQSEETFEQVINRMPAKKLNQILLEYAEREPGLANLVLARSELRGDIPANEHFRQIIRDAVNAARDRNGFIGYWQSSEAVRGAEVALDKAQDFLDQSSPENAFPVFDVVLKEMVPLLLMADDSNGCIGGVINEAFRGLNECARQAKVPAFCKILFDYLLTESKHPRYHDWDDWRWELLAAAGEMAQTPRQRERLFRRIDQTAREYDFNNAGFSDFNAERGAVIKLAVIERTGTKGDGEAFINQNLNYTALREKALERALARKDYTQAGKLAMDGLSQDAKRGLPGLVTKWRRILLDIARAQRDKERVRKYALELFFDQCDFYDYTTYKKCFSAREWPQEAQSLIKQIKLSGDTRNLHLLLPEIFAREGYWNELLDYVKVNPSAGTLEQYSAHLAQRFPDDMAQVFEKVIVEQLAPSLGRGNYHYLAQFIRRFKKLGYQDRVRRLIAKLLDKYKNRPAMLEELRNI